MKTGDALRTTKVIRSQKTGVLLPRRGTFVRDIENLGRTLILVDFGSEIDQDQCPSQILYVDRKSTRLNSSHSGESRMPSSA